MEEVPNSVDILLQIILLYLGSETCINLWLWLIDPSLKRHFSLSPPKERITF